MRSQLVRLVCMLICWIHTIPPSNRLADINSRCKADFKDYYECMDYYRYGSADQSSW